MSESTYFLDLKNSRILRSIDSRLASMDTTLRIFPQTGYQLLRSSNITSYNDAEWNVQEGVLETGSTIATGEGSNKFIELYGTTNWTNTSVSLRYSKYSTGKFSATFLINLNARRGARGDDFQYKMVFPLSLIKNSLDTAATSIDSFGADSGNAISECSVVWYNPVTRKRWTKPGIFEGTVPHIEISTNLSPSRGDYFDATNLRINVSGFYDMDLENA